MDAQQNTSGPDITGLRIDESSRNDRRGGRRLRTGLIAGLALLIIVAAVLAFRGRTPAVEVTTARPAGEAGGVILLNASGYVTPRRRATIAAKITARVLDVLVDEGMNVGEGQVLARLDDSDAQRRLLAARMARNATAALIANLEVNLANSERELKRQLELEKAGFAAVEARELAQTTVDSLRAQIQAAREAGHGGRRRDRRGPTGCRQLHGPGPVRGGRGLQGRPGRRNGLADFRGRRFHPDGHRHDRGHGLSRDRGGRQRVLYRAGPAGPESRRRPGRLSRLAHPLEGPDRHPHGGPPEGHGQSPHLLRQARSPDPSRTWASKWPFWPRNPPGPGGPRRRRALIPKAAVRDADGKEVVFVVRENRLERRAVALGESRGTDVEVMAGVKPGDYRAREGA